MTSNTPSNKVPGLVDSELRKRKLRDNITSDDKMVPHAGYNHIDGVHIPKAKHYHGVKSEDFSPTEDTLYSQYASSSLMGETFDKQHHPKLSSNTLSESGTYISKTNNSASNVHLETYDNPVLEYCSDESSDDISSTLLSCKGKLKNPHATDSGSLENLLITEDTKDASKPETMLTMALQIVFPFLIAGCGMVAAGIVLDKVQVCLCFSYIKS